MECSLFTSGTVGGVVVGGPLSNLSARSPICSVSRMRSEEAVCWTGGCSGEEVGVTSSIVGSREPGLGGFFPRIDEAGESDNVLRRGELSGDTDGEDCVP